MTFLLRNWKYALILSGTLATLLFFGLWRLEVAETKNLQAEIDTLQDTVLERENDIKVCNDQKKITERQSNEFQKGLAARDRTIADLRRVRENAKCIPLLPR